MRRTLFEDVHEDFRASFRTFLERENIPHYEAANTSEMLDRVTEYLT